MAKAQQKRARKELERLWQAGHHLDWLVEVDNEPRTPELQRQIDQAWREILRRALRGRSAFDTFCAKIDRIADRPNVADLEVLLAFKSLLSGEAEAEDVLQDRAGLSAPYRTALDQLRKAGEAAPPWSRIEELLQLMALNPGKVSRKHYHELAGMLTGTPAEWAVRVAGEGMPVFRSLNHKNNLRKQPSYCLLDDLEQANHQLAQATEPLPPSLRRLLLLPLGVQVLHHLRHREPAASEAQITALLQPVADILRLGLGDLLPAEVVALLETGNHGPYGTKLLARMDANFATAPLEGKLLLLRDVRRMVRANMTRLGSGIDLFGPSRADAPKPLDALLLRCHGAIIEEFAQRMPRLAPRERRALIATIDPLLADDVRLLFQNDADHRALAGFLQQAMASGCMGVRLGLMAAMIASQTDNRRLAVAITTAFADGPLPTEEDLHWLIDEVGPMAVRCSLVLALVFDRLHGNAAMTSLFADLAWRELLTGLIIFSRFPKTTGRGLLSRLFEQEQPIFTASELKGLAELAGRVEALAPLRLYLTANPQGRMSGEGVRTWLEQSWTIEDGGALFIRTVGALLRAMPDAEGLEDLFMGNVDCKALVSEEQVRGIAVNVLRHRVEDLGGLSLAAMENLVRELFPLLDRHKDFASLLIRLGNTLAVRVAAGENQWAALRNRLDDRLRTLAATTSQRNRRSRRKKG